MANHCLCRIRMVKISQFGHQPYSLSFSKPKSFLPGEPNLRDDANVPHTHMDKGVFNPPGEPKLPDDTNVAHTDLDKDVFNPSGKY
ncbi:hypothetical protein TNCV_3369441 [Trichonephila clavipes]|uniref:Uncharacterized protein n=1 Tax=Trichonephila clavipes TaxID=2585209 RepID=A0A8X6UZA5_TRICX|nr:hypothetical protein TNCV_3369441 [Trichonephila clavipes]